MIGELELCGFHGNRKVIKSTTQVAVLILKRRERDTDMKHTEEKEILLNSKYLPTYLPMYLFIYLRAYTHKYMSLVSKVDDKEIKGGS